MLPPADNTVQHRVTAGLLRWWVALAVSLGAFGVGGQIWAQDIDGRQDLRRSLREYLFFNVQLGLRSQTAVYADDSIEGPDGRSELRFHLNGRYLSAPTGGLGAYLGLGVIRRFGTGGALADPFYSPYDDFQVSQNTRLFGAYVQYGLRDEHGRPTLSIKAGRLSDFDPRAQLLMYDGLQAKLAIGSILKVGAFAGRRATLDGDVADQRTGVAAQLVSGLYADVDLDAVHIVVSHRFEEVQQAGLRVQWVPLSNLGLTGSAQLVFGGDEARAADASLTGLATSEAGFATVLSFDGDYSTLSGQTGVYLSSQVQLGVDPRVYGRAGRGPGAADIDAALRVPMSESRLDRLFFGPSQPHMLGEFGLEHWFDPKVGLRVGGYARMPLGDAAKRSLQPQVVEGWLGPEFASAGGNRLSLELRLAQEDPGVADRIFASQGDGERRYGALRAFGEVPVRLSSGWAIAFRPEVEVTVWNSEGPLSVAENQLSYFGGLLTSLRAGPNFRAALRYGLGTQPDFSAQGLSLVHDLEFWVSGAF